MGNSKPKAFSVLSHTRPSQRTHLGRGLGDCLRGSSAGDAGARNQLSRYRLFAIRTSATTVVGVGIMVAHNPLHGSGRAGLLHPALASGNDAKAYPRIRMTDACMRKPPCNLALHPSPGQMTFLAAPFEHSPPDSSQCHAKVTDRHCIHRHSVVTHMAKQNRAHIGTHLGHGLMHTPTKLGLDSSKLRLPPRAHRLSKHRKPSLARLSATVRESQEVKGLGLALTSALPVFFRMPAELNQARLLGMQFQPKTNQPFPKLTQEPLP